GVSNVRVFGGSLRRADTYGCFRVVLQQDMLVRAKAEGLELYVTSLAVLPTQQQCFCSLWRDCTFRQQSAAGIEDAAAVATEAAVVAVAGARRCKGDGLWLDS
ncbi:unnamed protein product, partial [Laminaria digitata]